MASNKVNNNRISDGKIPIPQEYNSFYHWQKLEDANSPWVIL